MHEANKVAFCNVYRNRWLGQSPSATVATEYELFVSAQILLPN